MVPGEDGVANGLGHGRDFAGEVGLVAGGLAFDDFGVHRELGAGLDQQAHAAAQLLHLHLAFLAPLVEHRGELGRVAEQRPNLPLGAAERKTLQRAGKGEEEQQRRAFAPGADAGAAERDGQHEKVDVNGAFSQPFPNVLRGEPTARNIGQHIADHRERLGAEIPGAQPKHPAQRWPPPVPPSTRALFRVLQELDVALDDFRPGNIAPAPELRRGGTGDAGDGRRVGFLANGDLLALEVGERLAASLAGGLARQQRAGLHGVAFLRLLDGRADALGQFGNVGLAQRGDGNGVVRLVHGHRFERRVLGQRLRQPSAPGTCPRSRLA